MQLTPDVVKNMTGNGQALANISIAVTMMALQGLRDHIKAGYTLEQLLEECDNFENKYIKGNEKAKELYENLLKVNPHKP